ncbi:NADH:ubiquinone reductase (Na(+)-transporting) subunit F [Pseudothermotoga sp. U03pept]|uniref:NADH:ubiquinone reductase (Na(+)-transporting) subunit F n=1 Tax=Pseudothermotoga sp. U03pept TaxID=3447012 RepID=UPI003F03B511
MRVLVEPLIVSLVSFLLALIIVIVDAVVNNYGEVKITVNKKKTMTVKGGAPLLFTLASQGIFIPSACGGRGSCGVCKVKVLSDVGPYLPTEFAYISKEQMKENVRLSCQVKVKKDIEIEIPEELLYAKKFQAVVEKINNVTYDIKELTLKLIEPKTIDFKAGQYIQLSIPPYGKINEVTQRAYSISSPPSENERIQLLIRLVPGGAATTYVHNYMKEGEKVQFTGPFGEFYVRETDAVMICVAGGSGMAPLRSIIIDLYQKNVEREIWYFFGARAMKDLFYVDFFMELEKKRKNFHFIPALSSPDPQDRWNGEIGLITDVLDKYLKGRIDQSKPKEGYLCGSPGMINACVQVMKNNGISEEKIYFDKFA